MVNDIARKVGLSVAIFAGCAIAASLLWHVPYVFTIIALLGVGLVGSLVTLDDDLPGGWSPHPGGRRAVVTLFAVLVCVFTAAVAVAVFFPSLRAFGGK